MTLRRLTLKFVVLIWLAAASCGMGLLWHYANAAGEAARAPLLWPPDSRIPRAQRLASLLVLVHPHCPCTRATLGELAKLMAQAQGTVEARVVFVRPPGVPLDWEKTDLWQTASAIPGVSVVCDEGGREAQRFGARTSGQVLLYDRSGRLIFGGGITAARGHTGDNAGRAAAVALLNTGHADTAETRVYGCPLFSPRDACEAGESCPVPTGQGQN